MGERLKIVRLQKAAREFNVGISTIVDYLNKKGIRIESNPNTKLTPEIYEILLREFESEKNVKEEASKIGLSYAEHETVSIDDGKAKKTEDDAVKKEPLSKEAPQDDLFIKTKTISSDTSKEKEAQKEVVADKKVSTKEDDAQIAAEKPKETTREKEEAKESKPEPAEKPAEKSEKEKTSIEDESSGKADDKIKEEAKEEVKEKAAKEDKKSKKESPEEKEQLTEAKESATEKKETIAEKKETIAEKKDAEKEEVEPKGKDTKDQKSKESPEKDDNKLKILGNIDLTAINSKTKPSRKTKEQKQQEREAKLREQKEKQKKAAQKPVSKEDEKEKQEKKGKTVSKATADTKQKSRPDKETKPEKPDTKADKPEKDVATAQKEEKQASPEKTQPAAEKEGKTAPEEKAVNFLKTEVEKLSGPKILGTIDLPVDKKPEKKKKPVASSSDDQVKNKKKKRRRIKKSPQEQEGHHKKQQSSKAKAKDRKTHHREAKQELSEEEIQKQIKDTLQRLSSSGKSKASKHRKHKRELQKGHREEEETRREEEKKIIKATEFVTVSELATMMNVPATDIIQTCMSLGLFVSINQRLDAETLTLVAEEFGYKVEFVSVEVQEAIQEHEEVDEPEELESRAPIVTVMGHVDHGKTSLLDYIRHTNVIAGESGGITQHIGAYEVILENGKSITFLDTPGHEAFTAMRARGAQVTDVAIIVVAADDDIMPQTVEAINHAQAAGVPIVFAINKIDKANANPEKIKEALANMNILVEDWGGNFQSQDISAKQGKNIEPLLEKVLLEAEMLELKGNPNKPAKGTVVESSLDKGRGYVAKLLVQDGTIKIGDMVLAGACFGKVKAMYNERNLPLTEAGPSKAVLLLGLNGAPQAGDQFNVLLDEKEAKTIANKRLQLQREQGLRTQKHITLDEIGRRIAIGDFKELNIIVKGDVDGSVEALSDSMLKLSTDEVQVNVIHKSVGQVTETDVMLASASNAVIVGFQVRPSIQARKLAEQEQIDIRLYSVIYQAIDEIKAAIEGMLAPKYEEKIVGNIEVRETFKISKVGTVAGCYVIDGKISRNTNIRLIRDGIVVYTGKLGSLKRFKDDVREVVSGYECGLNIENFNDVKVGDIIEGYEEVEIERKL